MAPVNGWPAGGSEGGEHPLMHYLQMLVELAHFSSGTGSPGAASRR